MKPETIAAAVESKDAHWRQLREEQETRKKELAARDARAEACRGRADKVVGGFNTFARLTAPQATLARPDQYDRAGRDALTKALAEPMVVVVNLGPMVDPTTLSDLQHDGNVYVRLTGRSGHMIDPATYGGTPDTFEVVAFTRREDGATFTIDSTFEAYSRTKLLGKDGLGTDDLIAGAESSLDYLEGQAGDTLALLYDRACNPDLNPELAVFLAERAPINATA